MKNLPLAARNLTRAFLRVLVNRAAKTARQGERRARRASKRIAETAKTVRARVRGAAQLAQDATMWSYRGTVRMGRYSKRVQHQATDRIRRDVTVRRELRRAARGAQPIIAGPWLSEVGFEALYWVPFLRWFAERYRVPASRLVVLSRGGVSSWYAGIADHYVEMLDVMPPDEFAALNAARQRAGEQKQHGLSSLDQELLRRVRARPGLESATVCHPSAMFRLLRQFWLGNESLDYLLGYLDFAPIAPPPLPHGVRLPERFVAIKFYTGRALPETAENHAHLRALVARLSARTPVVTLETGLALDEHRDYTFRDVPGVIGLSEWLTPQNNLGLQTAVIARAQAFIGTCGSLAWLAPKLGTSTVGVYADDELLTPHVYAARCAYRAIGAAPFSALDVHALAMVDADYYLRQ